MCMKNIQILSDKAAIGISLLCTMHCLALPLLIVLLPNLSVLNLTDEAFHTWMIFAVVPISIYALTVGCKKHKHYRLLAFGLLGVTLLILAVTLKEVLLNEMWEKTLSVMGAAIIAYGHYKNYRLCQNHDNCNCHGHSSESQE